MNELKTLYPLPDEPAPAVLPLPEDRRIQKNNAQRYAVHIGDQLAARLAQLTADTVDFQIAGLVLEWERAVERMRRLNA